MKLSQQINDGERLLNIYQKRIDDIDNGLIDDQNAPNAKAIRFLLNSEKENLGEKMTNISNRLKKLYRDYELQMDQISAECNANMDKTIEIAKRFYGKDPAAVTEKLKPLIDEYERFDVIDQERKNDIYTELKQHNLFLQKIHR